MLKKILVLLCIIILISHLIYKFYINDDYKHDITLYIVEQVFTSAYTGSGIIVLFKFFFVKNLKELLSEFLYIFLKSKVENHSVYKKLENMVETLSLRGYITDNKARITLLKDIMRTESALLSVFIATTIQQIITDKKKNENFFVVNTFSENFLEYNSCVIEIFESLDMPQIIVSKYMDFKESFIESVNFYLIYKTESLFPTFIVLLNIVDTISVSIEIFIKMLIKEIDHMNGELQGIEYKEGIL